MPANINSPAAAHAGVAAWQVWRDIQLHWTAWQAARVCSCWPLAQGARALCQSRLVLLDRAHAPHGCKGSTVAFAWAPMRCVKPSSRTSLDCWQRISAAHACRQLLHVQTLPAQADQGLMMCLHWTAWQAARVWQTCRPCSCWPLAQGALPLCQQSTLVLLDRADATYGCRGCIMAFASASMRCVNSIKQDEPGLSAESQCCQYARAASTYLHYASSGWPERLRSCPASARVARMSCFTKDVARIMFTLGSLAGCRRSMYAG